MFLIINELKEYFKEATNKKYPEFLIDQDLTRIMGNYDREMEEYYLNEVESNIDSLKNDIRDCLDNY